jgi:hypothetical protein
MKHTKRLSDGSIDPEAIKGLHAVALTIDEYFNDEAREVGFVLLAFRFGDTGPPKYVSNAHRRDAINVMREQLKRLEAPTIKRGAPRGDKSHGSD